MEIALSKAKARLSELAARAGNGEEIVLTTHGRPRVQLTPIPKAVDREAIRRRRLAAIDRALADAAERAPDGRLPSARSADYLYGDDGLPA